MNWLQPTDGEKADVEKVLRTPIGAASPMWWAFAGVAGAGVAYWWMTRWARPINLEAGFGAAPEPVANPIAVEAAETYEMVPEAIADVVDTPPEMETVAEAEAEVAAAAEVEAAIEAVADDLTRLVGIGPKLAVSLAERGVTTYAAIASWGEGELSHFDRELSLKGRAVRDAWVAQAKRFSTEAMSALPE